MSIRKRTWGAENGKGSAWVATIPTRERNANGRIIRVTKAFRTQADARAWVAESTVNVASGKFAPSSKSITVEQAADNWLAYVRGEQRERTTIDSYKLHLRLYIKPRLGHVKLAELTTPSVETFRDGLVRDLSRP